VDVYNSINFREGTSSKMKVFNQKIDIYFSLSRYDYAQYSSQQILGSYSVSSYPKKKWLGA
jgi:hypothetical protein